jgi:hypothetical protein
VRRVLLGLLGLPLLLAACGEDDAVPEGAAREARVYAAIVADAADAADAAAGGGRDPGIVFVEPLDPDDPISLEVQAGVVQRVRREVDVRFVDSREAALDLDEPGAPVRGDGLLLGLGPVPEGRSRVEVEVRRYRHRDEEVRQVVALQRVEREWRVTDRQEVEADVG